MHNKQIQNTVVSPLQLPANMTLMEYLKSDEGKEQLKRTIEEYRKKHSQK